MSTNQATANDSTLAAEMRALDIMYSDASAPAPKHTNREAWLLAAVPMLAELIEKADGPTFPAPQVSVGFPGGRGRKSGKAIGQCWTVAGDSGSHIFLHPCLDDATRVLDVLLHELIHASVGLACQHRGAFKRVATKCGLVGKMTATEAGEELQQTLGRLSAKLGKFPHRKLDPSEATTGVKKQSTRMKKYECPGCGQIIRAACDDLACSCQECTDGADEPVLFQLAG